MFCDISYKSYYSIEKRKLIGEKLKVLSIEKDLDLYPHI